MPKNVYELNKDENIFLNGIDTLTKTYKKYTRTKEFFEQLQVYNHFLSSVSLSKGEKWKGEKDSRSVQEKLFA